MYNQHSARHESMKIDFFPFFAASTETRTQRGRKTRISHPIFRTRFAIKIFTGRGTGTLANGKIESSSVSVSMLSIPATRSRRWEERRRKRKRGGAHGANRTGGCPLGDTFNRLAANAFKMASTARNPLIDRSRVACQIYGFLGTSCREIVLFIDDLRYRTSRTRRWNRFRCLPSLESLGGGGSLFLMYFSYRTEDKFW